MVCFDVVFILGVSVFCYKVLVGVFGGGGAELRIGVCELLRLLFFSFFSFFSFFFLLVFQCLYTNPQ
jgi:hypothetical protein